MYIQTKSSHSQFPVGNFSIKNAINLEEGFHLLQTEINQIALSIVAKIRIEEMNCCILEWQKSKKGNQGLEGKWQQIKIEDKASLHKLLTKMEEGKFFICFNKQSRVVYTYKGEDAVHSWLARKIAEEMIKNLNHPIHSN
jgi:translation initiation factor IF-3